MCGWMCAQVSGMEAALFVSSGTMGNLLSILCHCSQNGSEFICGDNAHIYYYEGGTWGQRHVLDAWAVCLQCTVTLKFASMGCHCRWICIVGWRPPTPAAQPA